MAAVFLFVSATVASLQFDLDTPGAVTLVPGVQKQIISSRLPDGKLRVIVYGLDQSTFAGYFANVNAPVLSISNVVGANPDGSNANASVNKLSSPQGVEIEILR